MKLVVITGVSSGLGRALFDYLCDLDLFLVCVSRRYLPYQQLIAAKKPEKIILLEVNLGDYYELLENLKCLTPMALTNVTETIFINNAGSIDPIGKIGNLNSLELINSVNVNLTSPLILSNYLCSIKELNNKPFKLINISSGAATRPIEGWSLYCATKSGTRMFFEVLNKQEGNVTVYQIDPGVMDTKMQQDIRNTSEEECPNVGYFLNLNNKNQLVQPSVIADKILKQYVL